MSLDFTCLPPVYVCASDRIAGVSIDELYIGIQRDTSLALSNVCTDVFALDI